MLMGKPHYNVVIASPGNSFEAEYVQSLAQTLQYFMEQGITFTFLNKYSSFVPSARELTAIDSFVHDWEVSQIGGGKFTYDHVLWIDSDIMWTPEDVRLLMEANLPIVSGIYQTSPDGTIAAHFPDDKGRPTHINKVELMLHDEPVKVGGVGFGFVLVKRGVFETIPRPWFLIRRIKYDGIPFHTMVGEDYSWCAAAQNSGYDIWIHPQVKVGHIKQTIYTV